MLSVVFELYQIWYEIHTFVFTVCQGDMQPFEGDPYPRGRLTSLRNKPHAAKVARATFGINTWLNC